MVDSAVSYKRQSLQRLDRGAGEGAEIAVADLGRDSPVGPDGYESAAVDALDGRSPAHFGQGRRRGRLGFARQRVSRAVPL